MDPDITPRHVRGYFRDPHVDARKRLDVEISQLEARINTLRQTNDALAPQLEEQLYSLRHTRNTLALVNQLHPEILQEIFFVTQSLSPHKGKACLVLTWVSQYWRDLAHETTKLWSYIDFVHLDWFKVALSRSKSGALEFDLDFRSELPEKRFDVDSLLRLYLGHLVRTKGLKIGWDLDTAGPGKSRDWTSPAPILVKLDLWNMAIPPNLFSGACPSLQLLQLHHCILDQSNLPTMPCLEELFVVCPHPRIAPDVLITMLKTVGPTLERLTLTHVLTESPSSPEPDQTESSSPCRLEFVNLGCLDLSEGNSDLVATFLNHLSLPNLLAITFDLPEWEEPIVAEALVSARNSSPWDISLLRLEEGFAQTILHIYDSGMSSSNVDDRDTNESSDNIDGVSSIPATSTCQALFRLEDIPKAQTLEILDYFGEEATVLCLIITPPFFSTFLGLISQQLDDFFPIVKTFVDEDIPLDQATILSVQDTITFHNLLALELEGETRNRPQLSRADVRELKEWLMWRNMVGLRLETLTISNVAVPSVKLLNKSFNDIVDELEIDDVVEVEEAKLDEDESDSEGGDHGSDSDERETESSEDDSETEENEFNETT